MQRFRNRNVLFAWLILSAIVLGGGLIEAHSHDGLTSGKIGSVTLSSGHDLPDTTEHVDSSTSIKDEFCLACTVRHRRPIPTLDT